MPLRLYRRTRVNRYCAAPEHQPEFTKHPHVQADHDPRGGDPDHPVPQDDILWEIEGDAGGVRRIQETGRLSGVGHPGAGRLRAGLFGRQPDPLASGNDAYVRRTSSANEIASAATSPTISSASGTAEGDSASSVPAYWVTAAPSAICVKPMMPAAVPAACARTLTAPADRAGQQQAVAEIDDQLRPEHDDRPPMHREYRQHRRQRDAQRLRSRCPTRSSGRCRSASTAGRRRNCRPCSRSSRSRTTRRIPRRCAPSR